MQLLTANMITDMVLRDLSGGDVPNDSPYDYDMVRQHVIDACNEEFKAEVIMRKMGGEDDKTHLTQAIATYLVDVTYDAPTNRAKASLPAYFLSLKHNKGIHSVSPAKDSLNPMIRITNPGVTSKLPHGDLERMNYGYYSEGMDIFWMRDIKKEKIHQVLIKLIVGAGLGEDDVLPLLPESVGRIKDKAKLRSQNRTIQDRLNDGNPNIRIANEQPK